MELTPEERQRIYQEEKSRLEGRQEQKLTPPSKKRRWWKLAFWAFFLFVAVMAILEAGQKPEPTAMSPEQVEAQKARYAGCTEKLKKAQELDMIHDMQSKGASFKVLVGPTFFTVPIDAKQGFGEVVNCVILKGGSGGISYDFVHWQTGKRVGSWNGYKVEMD
jgi:hypothetical protein